MRHSDVFVLQLAGSPPSRCWPLLAYVCWLAQEVGDWLLAILLFPVELVSTVGAHSFLDGPSLANIVASDLLYTIFLGLFSMATVAAWSKSAVFGVVIAVFAGHHSHRLYRAAYLVAIIQAYIFTVLPSVYLGMATADEH